jgi:hypothetical protein
MRPFDSLSQINDTIALILSVMTRLRHSIVNTNRIE